MAPRRSARLATGGSEPPSLESSVASLPESTQASRSPKKRDAAVGTEGRLETSQASPQKAEAPLSTEVGSDALSNGGESDASLDVHHSYEFGGPLGTAAMMVFFPALLYYLWASLLHNDAKLLPLASVDHIRRIVDISREHARPTRQACGLYLGFMAFQLFLAIVVPGYMQEGLPVDSLRGKRLLYKCNTLFSCYITYVVVALLHFSGTLRLPIVIDRFGEIMTVAIITSFAVAGICYALTRHPVRMSGNPIYDYFMGACLNPRILGVDLKMTAEVRIPWLILFLLACAGAAKQHDDYGYVSPNSIFMVCATFVFVNACGKGEEMIPQTWDMQHEKFGWLLSFWNLAGVPFSYCQSILYMATRDPATYRFPTWAYVLLYTVWAVAYYIFDTAMAQKSAFKMQCAGNFRERKAFPQLYHRYVENPKFLQTAKGKLLIDGWWAYSRKPNYAADIFQVSTWALCAGFGSVLPYWYPFFFVIMLLHRVGRDTERCARKYGKDWERYCEIVPYQIFPGIL